MSITTITYRYVDGTLETFVDGRLTKGYLTVPAETLAKNLERERDLGKALGLYQAKEGADAAVKAERVLDLGLQVEAERRSGSVTVDRTQAESRGDAEPLRWTNAGGKVTPPGRRPTRRRDGGLRWVSAGSVEVRKDGGE